MLLPVLSNARLAAKRTSCINNLKQLGMGLSFYTEQFDGHYPDIGPNYTFCTADQLCMAMGLLGFTSVTYPTFYYDVDGTTKAQFGNLPESVRRGTIFDCPGDGKINRHGDYSYNHQLFDRSWWNAAPREPSTDGSLVDPVNTATLLCGGGRTAGSRRV